MDDLLQRIFFICSSSISPCSKNDYDRYTCCHYIQGVELGVKREVQIFLSDNRKLGGYTNKFITGIMFLIFMECIIKRILIIKPNSEFAFASPAGLQIFIIYVFKHYANSINEDQVWVCINVDDLLRVKLILCNKYYKIGENNDLSR